MAKTPYLTAPIKTTGMPPGVPYIIGNEAAERFSYYGMNSILVPFMTLHLMNAQGKPDLMTPEQAQEWYHAFVTVLYFLPMLGAFLADAIIGKFWTIMSLSVVYCFGHLALAVNDTRSGLIVGLGLIALGAGGIKPCVSANVGDQFGPTNQHLLTRVYNWFYFSINAGSAISTLLIPWMLERFGPGWAFGTPGIFMFIATVIFWSGRYKFAHIPPQGKAFTQELTSGDGLKSVLNLLILVPFVAMFWAIWQQNFSSWVIQAGKMDLHLFGKEWLPAQIQTVNPLFLLLMLPLFSYWLYPAISRFFPLNPLRKISIGLFLGAISFLIPAWIEGQLVAGQKPNIIWQVLAFIILTAAEIMVSVPHLEFSYTQATKRLKSIASALYLLAISLGNAFAAGVNHFIQNPNGTSKLAGPSYFLFFAGVLFVTAILFIFVAMNYKGKIYIQDEAPAS